MATELLALLFGECVRESSSCHHFLRIFEVACPRVVAEFFFLCLCLRSSSDLVEDRHRSLEALTRTLPLEGGLRSGLMVVDQRAYSPSLLELDVWRVAEAEEQFATLALNEVQCLLESAHNSGEFYVPLSLVVVNLLGWHVAMQRPAVQVLEQVKVVIQLSMGPRFCMVRCVDVDATRNLCPIGCAPL